MSSKTLEGYHYGNKGKFECWNGAHSMCLENKPASVVGYLDVMEEGG